MARATPLGSGTDAAGGSLQLTSDADGLKLCTLLGPHHLHHGVTALL